MKTYKELYTLIEQEIAALPVNGQPHELYDPISYMLSLGGKRLRPILVLMGCDVFGKPVELGIKAALAVEVFHNFTLVHDDIMDNADIRRGKATVHKKWNQTIAILSGDLMMIKATELLCETAVQDIRPLLTVFNKTAAEVCEGQQWDMNFETMTEVTDAQYLHMITLKTAVLLGASLKLGALIAGAETHEANHLYDFGKNIGIAFQIHDDILDSFGDGDKVGKKIGGDILANKKTLLLIEALNTAKGTQLTALQNWLSNNDNSDEKINAVLAIYRACGVREKAEKVKEHFLTEAFSHLNALDSNGSRTTLLRQTAVDLMERMS